MTDEKKKNLALNWAIGLHRIKPLAKIILMRLIQNSTNEVATISISRLSEESECSEGAVKAHLSRLQDLDILKKLPIRPGIGSGWRLSTFKISIPEYICKIDETA